MIEISLQALLEAGCHFGHRAERWHPKAAEFIYAEKDGVHIIDLAKTKLGLEAAVEFIKEVAARGDEVLFVATKRQAKDVVKEAAISAGAPYLVERWIGGFLTNWDGIKKNIEKINRMVDEKERGIWKKYPKHEQSKLNRYLTRLNTFYSGVLDLKTPPAVLFIVDIRRELAAVREGLRRGVPVVAIVDTNADPTLIDYTIPANDDAVGSVKYIADVVAQAYRQGKEMREKEVVSEKAVSEKAISEEVKSEKVEEAKVEVKAEEPKKKKAIDVNKTK